MKEQITIYTAAITEAIAEMQKSLADEDYMRAFPEMRPWFEGRISAYESLLKVYG